jgi:CubicO group peptidase (beta-lactamase class C family)
MPSAPQTPPWPQAQPEERGFARDLADRLDYGIRSGLLRGLHAVLVARAGRLVLERYDAGVDYAWARSLGEVRFGPETLHDLRSVTKSIVALLYGIALERGLVAAPEAPLLAQFPEYDDLAADPQRARLTIDHALTMTLGIEWNEQVPYTDPANSEIAMERAPDRIRFILERPVVEAPGARWNYCGGATALIGALIAKGAGMPLEDFARENLFAPLGITAFEWMSGRDGVASAASGLRLRPRDLLRIGELMLAQGWWGDRQVIPRQWIERVVKPVIPTGDGLQYGRHWFLGEATVPAAPERPQPWIGAFGNGGQRLWIMPGMHLCAVILAGNYDTPDGWVFPTRVWREIILPNLIRT